MTPAILSGLSLVLAAWIPAPFVMLGYAGKRRLGWTGVILAVVTYGAAAVANLVWHEWLEAAVAAAVVLYILVLLWRRWRKGQRAARNYGAKSFARIAALARKARERAKPRRALRPVPEGTS